MQQESTQPSAAVADSGSTQQQEGSDSTTSPAAAKLHVVSVSDLEASEAAVTAGRQVLKNSQADTTQGGNTGHHASTATLP